jgi:TonB-linked SusC/RagA family outer membrane protein
MNTCRFLLIVAFLIPSYGALAQTGEITGVVTDSTGGQSLPGVNVVIQGTQRGAATDANGRYTISNVQPGTYTLQASFIGYDTKTIPGVEVTADETTTQDVALVPAEVGLDEVVVVGYGTQERRDVTGAVATVDGEALSRIPTPNVTQALQGQVAGVQITPTSGEPGEDAVVRIRGVGTLNNASPLYVVDGMLTDDISFLSSQDIESIEVLKDASATAIYGSRGANGVIIVTTKQGSYGQGTIYNLDVYYGMSEVMDPIELTGPQEYARLANEVVRNEQGSDAELPFPDPQSVSTPDWWDGNWQDVAFRPAPIQSYQLSARGGTDRVSYNFSGNFIREDGIVEKSNLQRISARLNNDYVLSDSIEIGHNIAFTMSEGVEAPGVISAVYRADPTIAPRTAEVDDVISPPTGESEFTNVGIRASSGNPAASIFYHRNEYTENRLVGDVFLNAFFQEHFRFKTSFGLDLRRRETRNFSPEFFVSPAQQNEQSSINVQQLEETSWLWENTLNYNQTFGDHEIDAVTGVTAQEFQQEVLGGSRVGVVGESESLWYLNAGEAEGQSNFNSAFDWSMLSFLFRTNYTYLGRYLFTVTGRVDGSSRFGEENRYGYFPSFAAGWRISDEPFLSDVEVLSNLKIRASWGRIGNDKIGAYPSIPTVTTNLNAVFGVPGSLAFGATPAELANPNVQWEATTQTDIGLELGFLNNRLSAEVDYYRRVTDGILVRVPIPDLVGVNVEPVVNAAEVLNRGFDLNLSWDDNVGGDFSYRIGLVGSKLHNEVLSLGQGREEIFGGGLVNEISFTTLTRPGHPIGAFYGFEVAGIYQTEDEIQNLPAPPGGTDVVAPGDFRYVDVNDDGVITAEDRTFIGSPIPDYVYGIQLSTTWRGLNVAVDFNGQIGNEVFNAKKAVRFGIENFEESYLDRWTGPGTSTSEPRVTNAGWNYQVSEWYLSDGSYFKLRNVRVGYALPGSWLNPMGLQRTQVYVNGTNLFTLSEYPGYTPEIGSESVIANGLDTGLYPIPRTITVGINATF